MEGAGGPPSFSLLSRYAISFGSFLELLSSSLPRISSPFPLVFSRPHSDFLHWPLGAPSLSPGCPFTSSVPTPCSLPALLIPSQALHVPPSPLCPPHRRVGKVNRTLLWVFLHYCVGQQPSMAFAPLSSREKNWGLHKQILGLPWVLQISLASNLMSFYKGPLSTKGPNSNRHPCSLARCQGCPAAGAPNTDEPEPEVPWPPQPINKGLYLMCISSSIRHALHGSPAPTLCYKQDRGLLMSLTFLSGTQP